MAKTDLIERLRDSRAIDNKGDEWSLDATADRIEALEIVAATVTRHTHQRAMVVAYQPHDVEQHACPLCRALINAGELTEDEVGIQSRSQDQHLGEQK